MGRVVMATNPSHLAAHFWIVVVVVAVAVARAREDVAVAVAVAAVVAVAVAVVAVTAVDVASDDAKTATTESPKMANKRNPQPKLWQAMRV